MLSIVSLLRLGYQQRANLFQICRDLIQTDGLKGLGCGLHATIWRDTFTYGAHRSFPFSIERKV
jgi:hypothetical protein